MKVSTVAAGMICATALGGVTGCVTATAGPPRGANPVLAMAVPDRIGPSAPSAAPASPPVLVVQAPPGEDRVEYTGPPPITRAPPPRTREGEDRVEYIGPPQLTQAPPPPPRPPVITAVQWSRRPEMQAGDYPVQALQLGLSGRVVVRCTARSDGAPVNCRVASEDPVGYGFGEAAVRIVERGRLTPLTIDGAATNATFQVTIPFTLSE